MKLAIFITDRSVTQYIYDNNKVTNHQFAGKLVKKPRIIPICIMNQKTGDIGYRLPINTNATNAIQPKRPISNITSERVSAFIASFNAV